MEKSIFFLPEVLREIEKYVEVRLHTDRDTEASRALQEIQRKRLDDVSKPIYEIVDPATGKTVDVFRGADILSGGKEFSRFLARNSRS